MAPQTLRLLCVCAFALFACGLEAAPFGKAKTRTAGGRTEYIFDDGTVIRTGVKANFRIRTGSREAELEKGTALISAPKGSGGGLIDVGEAVATFTHGDLEVANVAGTAKIICLTGKIQVRSTRDLSARVTLGPGQMVTIAAGATEAPRKTVIDLAVLVSSSALLKMGPLPSSGLINKNAATQSKGVPNTAPPGASNTVSPAGAGPAMAAANAQVQQDAQAALAAQQLAAAQAQQAAAEAASNAARIASARQLAEAQRAAQAQQQPAGGSGGGSGGQGNQGNAFGPGGNQGGGQGGGQGNQGQGNNGNQGNKPPAPPGQNK